MVHITKTLLDSWQYCFDCHGGLESVAYDEFLKTLRREKSKPNKAMLNGLNFEEIVYRAANGDSIADDIKWRNGALAIADIIRGAQIQVPLSRTINVDGKIYLIEGVLDALRAGVIYDVKFVNKSMDGVDLYGKWFKSSQHPVYFYLVPEATEFQYLASDGDDVYIEVYHPEESVLIADIIHNFIESITQDGLLEVFMERWAI